MKISNLFFMTMLCVSSATVYAQTAEIFRQPYPLGEKLSPTPNFTGMACSIERTERVECSDGKCNFSST